MLAGGGVFINKEKIEDVNLLIGKSNLYKKKSIYLHKKGKKNYYLIIVQMDSYANRY